MPGTTCIVMASITTAQKACIGEFAVNLMEIFLVWKCSPFVVVMTA